MKKKVNPFGPKGWTPEQLQDLTGKTYVITGANAGAGFEASRILLRKGARVIMLNRSPEKSIAAISGLKAEFGGNADVSFIKMDLACLKSVVNATNEVNETVPHIDALICNAAIAQVANLQLTEDGFESQLGTNHYGHFLLCNLLFERVEKSKGRIVIVGSNGYKMGLKKIQFRDMNFTRNYNPMNSYCHSKLAQMVFGYELERRILASKRNVTVHICHPGASRTTLSKEEANLKTKILFTLLSPLAQSAERGSWPEVMCATENRLKSMAYYGPTKRADMVGPVGECILEPFIFDKNVAGRLWKLSEEKTGVNWTL